MSRNFNKVIISGHLGQDPKENGAVTFSLAVNDTFSNDEGKQERTNWIPVVCFGRQAEAAKHFLKKGSHILLEGSLRVNEWTPEGGKKQTRIEVIATSFIFLDRKPTDHGDPA